MEYKKVKRGCKEPCDFRFDENLEQFVCSKCGYVLTKEDKRLALEKSMEMLRTEEEKEKTTEQEIKIIDVSINSSNNPFAYVRSEIDVKILLTNILRQYPDEGSVTKEALQFLYTIIRLLQESMSFKDCNFKNINKLLETCEMKDEHVPTTFHFIIDDIGHDEIKADYFGLEESFAEQTARYNSTVRICHQIMTFADENKCLQNLKTRLYPQQAIVKTNDNRIFDFWFYETDSHRTSLKEYGEIDGKIVAAVHSNYPFTYHEDGSAPLNENFLAFLIDQYDAIQKTEPVSPIISDKVAEMFSDFLYEEDDWETADILSDSPFPPS